MRTRQLPHQSLHPPQFPALPRSSPLDTAFLTPPPDLPISPLRSHFHSTSNTTAQSISLNHCSSTHHPTPHPVHQPQLALPQPPQVEESDEQIEKMLEDIMMGLNILPPMVLEKDCDRHHHLQSHDRPSACSCSHHPVHARHCGMHSAIGSASRCMCSQREGSDALSTETAFHSIISSHFVTTTTTCTVTPDLYLDPQPLTPHCSTPHPSTPHHHSHPSTPHHHSHPHFSCNDYSSDWTECNRASYCSGVLQCSSENAKNHHELLVRFQNQNSQNQELQNRNSKSLVVGCGGSSSIIPVHSGPSPRPPHHHQSLPQSQASLPYTGEEDRDPGCWKGSSAQTGIPSTSKEYVCNLSSADCLSTNGKTTPSQVNGDTTPSQVNGDSTPSQVNGDTTPSQVNGEAIPSQSLSQASTNHEVPQEEEPMAVTPGFLPPSETDASEPQHPACPPDATPGRGLGFPELLSLLSRGSETQPSQSPPPHWEELRLPKCLSPLNSPEPSPPPSPTKPFLKSPFRHPATPFHRIPQLSKLPPWLCRTPRRLQFPLSSMIHSPRSRGNLCESKKCLLLPLESNNNSEQMTDGQDRASISNNSRLAGKEGEEEWKRKKVVTTTTGRRLEKPKAKRSEGDETLKPHSNRKRIRVRRKEGFEAEQGRRIEKLKAKTERSQGDETWNPPRNRTRIHERRTEGLKAEQEQSEDSETLEPRRKKRKRNVSTKIEVGDEDIKTERVKLNDGTKTENGQVKISICSVSLATNNVLASERLGRYLSNTSTTSTKSLSSLGEEANGPPEGIKRLRREMGNPVRVLRARDRDVKRPPNVWTATRSCSPVKLHQEDQPSNVSSETPSPSFSRFQALANAVGLLQIPPTPPPNRKRGRPRKIRPGKKQVSQAGGSVPSSAMTTGIHDGEAVEHKKEKGREPQRKEKGSGEPQGKEKGVGEPQGKEQGVREPQGKEKRVRESQGKEKGVRESQGKEKGGGEPQGKEKGSGEPQGKEKGVRELQGKEKGVRELQGKDDKRNKYRKRVRLWEGHGEGERAELFQRLPVLSKSKTVAQKPSLQTTSPSTPEEQVPSNCSGIGTGTIPEPQPSGQPQNSSPERSGETESDRDQVSPPAVKLAPSKGRAPTVSLKKFQELLKHRHQKTRKSAKSKEAKETESETEGEKQSEGKLKLLKPNEIDSGQNESRLMNKKKSYSQSLERESAVRPTVENYDQTNRTESDHPEEKDAGHNSSTCGQETEYQELIYKETERENIEDREHFENTENVEDGENVDASGDFSELREELATLAMLSMTRTKKMVDPQRTDKGNKEGRDLVTKENRERETDSSTETNKKTEEPKGSMLEAYRRSVIIREVEEKMEDGYLEMEISSEEFDVVDEVHQTFGYAVTEEVSGEEEEIDVEEMCPTMYPDAAWQEVSGAREVDQSSSTMVSFRGITHNHFHMATAAPKMADVSLPTPLEAEPSTLTSSRRVTTGSIGSWEPEEEEEVEVDVLEWSPDVRPIVWGAGLEQGVTELTEEDLEEDEIDVMGEETD
ncbi:hypothetical protein J4Q44_G00039000 [Coregonus suidteri]|uniref:Uncharacterized protein n=1 Tax=Coregonus suidteri TaxID=861788 RepID=A0AAN8R5E2_9TELE